MHQLSIGFFQAGYPVPDGTTKAVTGLATGLSQLGHRITIYGCGFNSQEFAPVNTSTLSTHIYPEPSKFGFALPSQLLHRLARNEDELSLLVINTMFNPPNLAIARAARRGGVPYIVSPHDPYHPELLSKNPLRKIAYLQCFERPYVRRAAGVQVLSPEHAAYLKLFGAPNVVVIPNGFEPAITRPQCGEVQTDAWTLPGWPKLLSLGRVDMHHKGLDLLLRGFGHALRTGSAPESTALSIVGPDDGDTSNLRVIAKEEGIEAKVRFTGRVSDNMREAMLRECDALLLCSRYDGFGFVVLEAMLARKPVIVSQRAGIASYVREAGCGFVIDPSPAGVEEGLRFLMAAHSSWRHLGQKGFDFANYNLTWRAAAECATSCYGQLLEYLNDSSNTRNSGQIFVGSLERQLQVGEHPGSN